MHQLIDRLVRRLDDINQPFMNFDHKILTAIAVDECRSRHIEMFLIRRKRYRTHDTGTRTHGGIKNLLAAVVYDPAVIRF